MTNHVEEAKPNETAAAPAIPVATPAGGAADCRLCTALSAACNKILLFLRSADLREHLATSTGKRLNTFKSSIIYTLITALVFVGFIWMALHMSNVVLDEYHNKFTGAVIKTCATVLQDSKLPPCAQSLSFFPWNWVLTEVPCQPPLVTHIDIGAFTAKFCIDQFNIWEAFAIFQTAFIAFLLLVELEGKHARIISVCLTVVIIVFPIVSLAFILGHHWEARLLATFLFFTAIFIADVWVYWDAEKTTPQAKLLRRTIFGADIPMLISNVVLIYFLYSRGNPANHIFFAGSTAFGLVFANLLVLVLRLADLRARWIGSISVLQQPGTPVTVRSPVAVDD
jgi:hypothetical protein